MIRIQHLAGFFQAYIDPHIFKAFLTQIYCHPAAATSVIRKLAMVFVSKWLLFRPATQGTHLVVEVALLSTYVQDNIGSQLCYLLHGAHTQTHAFALNAFHLDTYKHTDKHTNTDTDTDTDTRMIHTNEYCYFLPIMLFLNNCILQWQWQFPVYLSHIFHIAVWSFFWRILNQIYKYITRKIYIETLLHFKGHQKNSRRFCIKEQHLS